jgi:hypothetical protein
MLETTTPIVTTIATSAAEREPVSAIGITSGTPERFSREISICREAVNVGRCGNATACMRSTEPKAGC